ncbi:hypothetical protein K402DRAFT_142801 [Aulographum hederae CBS 113979]|uniref:Mtf2-like C-terminal domain-containing protein n=1 Tax=Aulographum hederae CBS 113979 TaxID=1176131 RepID=A0A6G1GUC5_9PEZI|nr:hypothetical protein K402DRAFT_142801 [Aulographum hederae CBS 113979]
MSKPITAHRLLARCFQSPRHRTATPVLLPFLYQTRTIQNHAPPHPISHARPRATDSVPFEGQELTNLLDFEGGRKESTVTNTEQAAFARLFGRVNKDVQKDLPTHISQAEGSAAKAEALEFVSKFAEPLRDVAAAAVVLQREKGADALHKRKAKRLAMLREKISEAPDDFKLWRILEDTLFSPIRNLDLENPPLPKKGANKRTKKAATTAKPKYEHKMEENIVLQAIYPQVLAFAAKHLRVNFPASALLLAILPAVKAIGRDSYALGASTALYNELLRYHLSVSAHSDTVDSLFQDMENGGIEFNLQTLEILEEAAHQNHQVLIGGSQALQDFWALDSMRQWLKKIDEWIGVVTKRMEEAVMEFAQEKERLLMDASDEHQTP